MRKNGFTLIELLAVIVILAIIALIATPIILGIINDAREESNERSVELYASAVRNAIASYQLTGTTAPTSFDDLDIQYDGNVVCATEELYEDGSFYIADCTVNGDAVDYTYGEQQVTQPTRYYSWSSFGNIGGDLPSDAKTTVAELNPSYPFYLGLDVDANNKVSAAYVCFRIEENVTEYCLKGEPQEDKKTETFESNNDILLEAFGESSCSFEDHDTHCSASSLVAIVYSDGNVSAGDGSAECDVRGDGVFDCDEFLVVLLLPTHLEIYNLKTEFDRFVVPNDSVGINLVYVSLGTLICLYNKKLTRVKSLVRLLTNNNLKTVFYFF